MSVKYTRDGRAIPADLYAIIKAVQDRGGKALWAIPFEKEGGCPNCGGCGQTIIQVIAGGQFESIPTNTQGYLHYQGKHYRGKTHVRPCISCQGTGARVAARPPTETAGDPAEHWADQAYGD